MIALLTSEYEFYRNTGKHITFIIIKNGHTYGIRVETYLSDEKGPLHMQRDE
jgi:hypothetical protein